jgi:hypothetical protein
MNNFEKFLLLLSAVLLSVTAGFSQNDTCQHRTIPVGVTDKSGANITNLSSTSFQAEFRGKTAQIVSFTEPKESRRILLELDTSASMKGATGNRWKTAMGTAARLVNSRLPNTTLGLYVFGEGPSVKVTFAQGDAAVADALQAIQSDSDYANTRLKGTTNLAEAMTAGFQFFDTPRPGDVIFMITDVESTLTHPEADKLTEIASAKGVRLFFCALSLDGIAGNTFQQGFVDELRNMAENTGGLSLGAVGPRPTETPEHSGSMVLTPNTQLDENTRARRESQSFSDWLTERLQYFFQQMANERLLEVQFASAVDKADKLKLTLSKEESKQYKGATVIYPHAVEVCSQATGN